MRDSRARGFIIREQIVNDNNYRRRPSIAPLYRLPQLLSGETFVLFVGVGGCPAAILGGAIILPANAHAGLTLTMARSISQFIVGGKLEERQAVYAWSKAPA